MRAIQTFYNGYRFRSLIEARWAVFFDTLRIPYIYEKEGFDLGDGVKYLPDFWLPSMKAWAEVKATEPNETEMDKAVRLSLQSVRPVYLLVGIPSPREVIAVDCGVPVCGYHWISGPDDIELAPWPYEDNACIYDAFCAAKQFRPDRRYQSPC